MISTLRSQLSALPSKPGVYIFRDQQGFALYVGKAVNLKNRVRSYFTKGLELGPKTAAMISKTSKVEHIVVESEIEALLLESDLIKRLKPKYNVQWKDDKAYKFIKISNSKFLISKFGEPMPGCFVKVATSRTADDKSARYFGPFPEGKTVSQVLRTLRKVFPFRDCSEAKFKRYQKLGRSCLYGDLKLCPAPCVGRISPKEYQKIIKQLTLFLSVRRKGLIRQLEREMQKASKEKRYEEATILRDRIRNFEYITQGFRPAADYLKHPDLLEDQRRKELGELAKIVNLPAGKAGRQSSIELKRIEAYDISDISGKYASGSMVVFVDGEPSKRDYRRFKIKTVKRISDVDMIKEVLKRRLARIGEPISADKSFAEIPDLILVDGGKPQVNAVNKVLKESGLKIPVLGLAKKFEEIVKSDLSLVKLPKDSLALHLLQRIRDEAHRFAVFYHRKLRSC